MKHPTDEDIEKYAIEESEKMVAKGTSFEIMAAGLYSGIHVGAKWARDQQDPDQHLKEFIEFVNENLRQGPVSMVVGINLSAIEAFKAHQKFKSENS